MTDPTPLQAALDDLAAAEAAMDTGVRLQFAQATLASGGFGSTQPPAAKAIWAALHPIVNSGATQPRLDALIAALRGGGSATRMAFAVVAGEAIEGDPPRAAVWKALHGLVWALGEDTPTT